MAKTKPPYPVAFREQIVELARAGRSPAELSREFGPTAQSIANWIAQAARDAGRPLVGKEGLSSAERDELVRLRRQLKQVQMERDILAKACVHGSPARASGRPRRLPSREREPGRTPRANHVQSVDGLGQRLLRLARAPALRQEPGQR